MTKMELSEVERFARATAQAYDVLWTSFAESYPEVETGDFGPGETMAIEEAILQAFQLWLFYNHPDRDLAQRILQWRVDLIDIGCANHPHIPDGVVPVTQVSAIDNSVKTD